MAKTRSLVSLVLTIVFAAGASVAFANGGSFIGPSYPSNLAQILEDILEEIENLQGDVYALEGKLDDASTGLSAITQIVEGNQYRLDNLEVKLDDEEYGLGALAARLDDETRYTDDDELAVLLGILVDEHDATQAAVASVEVKADTLEVKVDDGITDLLEGQEGIQLHLDDQDAAIDALEGKADLAESKLDSLEVKADDGLAALALLEGKADLAESKLDLAESKLDSLEVKADDGLAALAALEGKADNAEVKLDDIEATVHDNLFGLAALQVDIEAIETKLDDDDDGLDEIMDALIALEAKSDSILLDTGDILGDTGDILDNTDDILDDTTDLITDVALLQADVSDVLDDTGDILSGVNSVETKLDIGEIKLDALSNVASDVSDILDEVTNPDWGLAELDNEIESLQADAAAAAGALASVESKLDSAGLNPDLLNDLLDGVIAIEGKLDGADGLGTISAGVASIETKLDTSSPTVGEFVEDNNARLVALEAKLDAGGAIADGIAAIEGKIDVLPDPTAAIAALEAKLDGLDFGQTIGKDIEDLLVDVAAIEGKLDDATRFTSDAELAAAQAAVIAEADANEAKIDAVEAKLDDGTRFTSDAELAAAQAAVVAEVDANESKIDSLEVKLDGLDLAQNIGQDVEDLGTATAALETKLDALEAKLDDPTSGLAAIRAYLAGNTEGGGTVFESIGTEVEWLVYLLHQSPFKLVNLYGLVQGNSDILNCEDNFVSDAEFNAHLDDIFGAGHNLTDLGMDPDPGFPYCP